MRLYAMVILLLVVNMILEPPPTIALRSGDVDELIQEALVVCGNVLRARNRAVLIGSCLTIRALETIA